MDNIVTEINIIKTDKITLNKNMDKVVTDVNTLKTDKIGVTAMNRVADQVMNRATEKIDERLKSANKLDEDSIECVERAKQQDSDIKMHYDSQKDANIPSPYPSSSTSCPLCPLATATASNHYKLYLVQSLNAKEISAQPSTLNMQSDSIQSMA